LPFPLTDATVVEVVQVCQNKSNSLTYFYTFFQTLYTRNHYENLLKNDMFDLVFEVSDPLFEYEKWKLL